MQKLAKLKPAVTTIGARTSRAPRPLRSSTRSSMVPSTRGDAADSLRKLRVSSGWAKLQASNSSQASQTISEEDRNTLLTGAHATLRTLSLSFPKSQEYQSLKTDDQHTISGLTEGQKTLCESMLNWSHIYGGDTSLAGVFDAEKSAQSIEAPTILEILASTGDTLRRVSMVPEPEMYSPRWTDPSFAGAGVNSSAE